MIKSIDDANLILGDFANRYDIFQPHPGVSKAILYHGFYWRKISNNNVKIGISPNEGKVCFMQKNICHYEERLLCESEETQLIRLSIALDYARDEKRQYIALKNINEWMQSLTI